MATLEERARLLYDKNPIMFQIGDQRYPMQWDDLTDIERQPYLNDVEAWTLV